MPSKIASAAGIEINGKIDALTFSYVTETYQISEAVEAFEECNTILDPNYEVERIFCKDTMTVTNLTLAAIYEESFGNPTLLFNPVMVTDSVLTDEQKTILMQNDHGYLGVSVDRTQLPTSSTRDATNWLSDLQNNLESTEGFVPVYDSNGNETSFFLSFITFSTKRSGRSLEFNHPISPPFFANGPLEYFFAT